MRFCRVPRRKRTAKKKHTAKSTPYRVLAHGKVFSFGTRQNIQFAVCLFFWHTAKYIVCRVFFSAQGKVIIFFFSSHLETFSTLHIQHVVLLVKI